MKKSIFALGIPGMSVVTALLVWGMSLAGCATTVTLPVEHLPAMNTAGIKRIAIMRFETTDDSSQQKEIAGFLTSTATARIMDANYFTLVDPSEVERLQKSGESLENHIDALFIGQVISLNSKDSSAREERIRYNDNGTTSTYSVTVYKRETNVVFSYNFKRTRDGSLVGAVTKQGELYDSDENQSNLQSASALAQSIVQTELKNLAREVAPYTVTEKRTLMDETSKIKDLKSRMKAVRKVVEKERSYKSALKEYLALYQQYNSFAAGYNAAILYEVLGDLENAVAQMQTLESETGNPQAGEELARLRRAVQDRDTLTGAYKGTKTRNDTLIAQMVETIRRNLPENPQVAVMNNTKIEAALTDTFVDGITSGLRDQGITIVDRNNTALLSAEKQYQMSGEVSDADFVGIGNAAGVNRFVLVAISGTSNLRRLQVRILDVGTGTIIYQSPQSDDMNL